MPDVPLNLAEIEERITATRENLTELTEQAAAYSGAADEDLASRRIAQQEAQLELLTRRRDEFVARKSQPASRVSVKPHMEVIGADGVHIGTVDRIEGGRIKLAKADSGEGRHKGHHHFIDLGLVAGVEGERVRLSANAAVAVTLEEERSGKAT